MANGVSAALPSARTTDVGERLRLGFFRAFFRLLLAVIAVGEWLVIARVLARSGVAITPAQHALGIVGFYGVNLVVARRLRTRPRGPLLAAYAGFAFTSV